MKLIINKFPPIVEKCEIDLSKKLTLFVGKNNSGKTYVSQLIWAIYDFKNDSTLYINNLDSTLKIFDIQELKKEYILELSKEDLDKISAKFSKIFMERKIQSTFKNKMEVDIEILFTLKDFKEKRLKSGLSAFGLDIDFSKKKGSSKIEIKIKEKNDIDLIVEDIDLINKYLESTIIRAILSEDTIYMPSTRLFLPSFYKYIISIEKEFKDDIFNNFDKLNNQNKNFFQSTYTEPVYELIKKLIFDIDKPIKDNNYLTKLTNLIDGNISIDKSEELGMADISYTHSSGKKLPMYLSSSMVNQLATVYLYFKYWYKKDNSFLLLDEPEMNLHPEKKIEFTRILLDYASSNKLLIATHSSTLAKSIINYIHLFELKEKFDDKEIATFIERENLKMDSSINLVSNDIGIYYFNGRTITSYKKDNNSDIHFGTFTEIEKLQNKQYDYIMDELEK